MGALSDAVLPDEVRWDEVYRLAAEQGVLAIAFDGLKKRLAVTRNSNSDSKELVTSHGSVSGERLTSLRSLTSGKSLRLANEELYYSWLGQVMLQERGCEAQLDTIRRLLNLWDNNGLEVVALKGLAFAQYYPVPNHRQCGDFDCFFRYAPGVQAGGYEPWQWADKLVAELGIDVDNSETKHSRYVTNGLSVENHRNVIGVNGSKSRKEFDAFLQARLDAAVPSSIAGLPLLAPPWLFDALFCLAHAQVHLLEENGIALKHVLDWYVIRTAEDGTRTAEFHEAVDRFGLRRFYEALDGVADYVMGEKSDLTASEHLLLDDIFARKYKRHCKSKFTARLNILRTIWDNRRKYKYFSDTTMSATMWRYIYGHLFDRS